MENIPAFYFDFEKLTAIAKQNKNRFVQADPFPHIVLDNFLPEDILQILIKEFPGPDDVEWFVWGAGPRDFSKPGNKQVEKIGMSDERCFKPFTRHFMQQLNSSSFLYFLELLTDTYGLIPDPSYNACGLHSTGRGGKLMIHTDSNRHPQGKRFHQRYNLIFFLNQDWKEEYGGHLELWDRKAKKCVHRIAPVANRMVIFDTGKYSFHGHPHPLTCPEGRRRNTLAVYYYTLDRPKDQTYEGFQPSVTWIAQTPEEKESEKAYKKERQIKKAKFYIKKIVPPILIDAVNLFRPSEGK